MLAVLRRRNFFLLWSGALISLTGDWMLLIALPIYVYELTGSTLATGVMFVAKMLPGVLFGSVAGVFVDRWDRRRTMVFANLLMALSMLPLLAVPSTGRVWIVYAVAFAESSVAAFFRPAENSLLPRLVEERHLMVANSLNVLNNNLARLVGPALGGLAVGLLGLGGVALLNAASYLIAAAMISLITGRYRPLGEPSTEASSTAAAFTAVWREWAQGMRLVQGDRVILTIFVFLAVTGLGEGVIVTLLPAFVKEVLRGGALELGWLMSAQAVGGLIGGLVVGYAANALTPSRLLGLSAVAIGLIDLTIFNYPAFFSGITLGLILFVVVGVPVTGVLTSLYTLLQNATEDRYRGRVFGAFDTTQALLILVGTLVGGALGDVIGVVVVLNVQGGAYVLAGILVLMLLAGASVRKAEPSTENRRTGSAG